MTDRRNSSSIELSAIGYELYTVKKVNESSLGRNHRRNRAERRNDCQSSYTRAAGMCSMYISTSCYIYTYA
uniref:Uncharacterized protein n=1 Tax=Trichogramma kaykai TaxID=54128 RepID=A0ABD2X7X6_9HYME